MYETLEFYDSNGCDLKEVLKSCIYKYYIANKNLDISSKKVFILPVFLKVFQAISFIISHFSFFS